MANLNKVFLIGNLTRDPELSFTPNGNAVGKIGMAVNRVWKQNNEKKEETTFVDVTIWGKSAEAVHKYVKKGNPLFVEGRLHFHQWETQEGAKRSKLDVVAERVQFINAKTNTSGPEMAEETMGANFSTEGDDDDVPF